MRQIFKISLTMSLLVVGTVAFDGLETPFGVRARTPKGVSNPSNATVPTTKRLIVREILNICRKYTFSYCTDLSLFVLLQPFSKEHSSLAQLVRASDC